MLNRKSQRVSLVICLSGLILLAYAGLDWLKTPGHNFFVNTRYVPDGIIRYDSTQDWEGQAGGKNLIRKHQKCEWHGSLDGRRPLVMFDSIKYLDGPCMRNYVDAKSMSNKVDMCLWFFGNKDEICPAAQSKVSRFWFLPESEESLDYTKYNERSISKLTRAGVKHQLANDVVNACASEVFQYCLETQTAYYFHIWDEIIASPIILIGILLFLGGLMGSVFYNFSSILWRTSGGAVLNWIKKGA